MFISFYNIPFLNNFNAKINIMKLNKIFLLKSMVFFFIFFSLNNLAICQTEFTICEGDCIEIGGGSEFCYSWDNSFENPQQDFQIVCPSEKTLYSVTITDDNGNIENVTEYLVDIFSLDNIISPNPGTLCSNEPILLEVDQNFSNYIWENEEGENIGSNYFISVSTPGEYAVTVTNSNGCTATDVATVINPENPEDIKDYLISEGFFCVPVTVNGTVGFLAPVTDNLENTSTLSLEIEGDEEAHLRLVELLNNSIENIENAGFSPMMRITDYDAICSEGTTLNEFLDIEEFDVSYLSYIYDTPDSDEDCLLVKLNFLDMSKLNSSTLLPSEYNSYYCDRENTYLSSTCCQETQISSDACAFSHIASDSDNRHYMVDCTSEGDWQVNPSALTEYVAGNFSIHDMKSGDTNPAPPVTFSGSFSSGFEAWVHSFYSTEFLMSSMIAGLREGTGNLVGTNLAIGEDYLDRLFLQFRFGGGMPLNTPCDEPIVEYFSRVGKTRNTVNDLFDLIIPYYQANNTLFNFDQVWEAIPNSGFPRPSYRLPSIHTTLLGNAIFGGTQRLEVILSDFHQGRCYGNDESVIGLNFFGKIKIGDAFGISLEGDELQLFFMPGIAAQWTLQHYRNNDPICLDPPCFKPFHHTMEVPIARSFIMLCD